MRVKVRNNFEHSQTCTRVDAVEILAHYPFGSIKVLWISRENAAASKWEWSFYKVFQFEVVLRKYITIAQTGHLKTCKLMYVLTYRDKKNRKNKKNFAYLRKKKFFNNRYVATTVHRQVQVHALNIFLSKRWFGWIIQTFSAFSTALVLWSPIHMNKRVVIRYLWLIRWISFWSSYFITFLASKV